MAADKKFVVLRSAVTLTGTQTRLARGLIGWSQAELAAKANVSLDIVRMIERDERVAAQMMMRLRFAFERAKIEFPVDAAPRARA